MQTERHSAAALLRVNDDDSGISPRQTRALQQLSVSAEDKMRFDNRWFSANCSHSWLPQLTSSTAARAPVLATAGTGHRTCVPVSCASISLASTADWSFCIASSSAH